MINDFKDGGLRMLDIESFNKALKCSWIKKYLDDETKANGNFSWIWNWNVLGGRCFLLTT